MVQLSIQAVNDCNPFSNHYLYQNAFAVGEVKRWDTDLDRLGKGEHDKNTNPSFQIWPYLHETEPEWGVRSNGRLQRWGEVKRIIKEIVEVMFEWR